MKTGLLFGVAGVIAVGVVGGAANVWAACVPTKDCATLGYKYTAAQCNGKGVACPFDTSKFFCFEPQICNYTITAETCSSQCLNVGTKSCTKNGITYYESCGASMCSSGQTCENGTCRSPVAASGYCCGYSGCGYSGTSHSNDSVCQSYYGESCYNRCMRYYPTCDDMRASCRAQGGILHFQFCSSIENISYVSAIFGCE